MGKASLDLRAMFPEIEGIRDRELRAKVEAVWDRLWAESSFERVEDVPVSEKIARSHLPHARSIVRLALLVADVLEDAHGTRIDRDILVAGALLQDVGKLVEFEPTLDGYRRSALGTMLQHSIYAAHVALSLGVPLDVVHIMISHSPSSAVPPRSRECALLAWIDQLDLSGMGEETWERSVVHTHVS